MRYDFRGVTVEVRKGVLGPEHLAVNTELVITVVYVCIAELSYLGHPDEPDRNVLLEDDFKVVSDPFVVGRELAVNRALEHRLSVVALHHIPDTVGIDAILPFLSQFQHFYQHFMTKKNHKMVHPCCFDRGV